jgi:hypothetical protein
MDDSVNIAAHYAPGADTDIESIYSALAKAQTEMGKALKSATNPHFRSKYADLGAVMDACLPALNKHGISVIQPMVESEFGRGVKTLFLHTSGESVENIVPLIVGKQDMQGLGSAYTYARRYGLMGLAGIAPEDDDGNAAVTSVETAPPREKSWGQTVVDETCGLGASDAEKAEALADAILGEFERKSTRRQLDNEWDRRKSVFDWIMSKAPEQGARVESVYNTRVELFDLENEESA